jgi:hypothetical protein
MYLILCTIIYEFVHLSWSIYGSFRLFRFLRFGENALTLANLVRWMLTFGFSRFLIPSFLRAVTAAIVCINGVEVNGARTVGTSTLNYK